MVGGGETIKNFFVALGFKVDNAGRNKFNGALHEAEHAAHGLKHGLRELAQENGLLGGELAGIGKFLIGPGGFVVGCLAAVGALGHLTNEVTEELDELGNLSNRVGVSAAEIEAFGYAASQSDSSVAEARQGLDGLSKTLGEAAIGLGRGAKTFETLGLSAKDAHGNVKSTSEILEEVREKLKGLSDPEAQAALEKLGMPRTLLKTLRDTGLEAQKFAERLDESFGVDVNKLTRDAKEYRDTMGSISAVIEKAKQSIVQAFLPAFQSMAEWFREMTLRYGPGLSDMLIGLGYIAMGVSGIVVDAVKAVYEGFMFFIRPIMALIDEVFGEGQGKMTLFAIGLGVIGGLFLSTFGLIPAIIAGVIAALAALYEYWDKIAEAFSSSSFGKAAIAALSAIRSVITDVIDSVAKLISGFGKLFSGDFKGAFGDAVSIVGNIGHSVTTMAPALPPGAATVGSMMQAGATNATNIIQNFNGNADPAVVQRAAQNGAERGARNTQNAAAVATRG